MSAGIDIGVLRAARREFVEILLPKLDGSDRYTGAMLKRSLDVLLAGATADEPPEAVLEAAGLGAARALALALRARRHPDDAALRAVLRHFVERKLAITNPRFLSESRASDTVAR